MDALLRINTDGNSMQAPDLTATSYADNMGLADGPSRFYALHTRNGNSVIRP